jgi:hypothetical protein
MTASIKFFGQPTVSGDEFGVPHHVADSMCQSRLAQQEPQFNGRHRDHREVGLELSDDLTRSIQIIRAAPAG